VLYLITYHDKNCKRSFFSGKKESGNSHGRNFFNIGI
jgi:hypothetical protein